MIKKKRITSPEWTAAPERKESIDGASGPSLHLHAVVEDSDLDVRGFRVMDMMDPLASEDGGKGDNIMASEDGGKGKGRRSRNWRPVRLSLSCCVVCKERKVVVGVSEEDVGASVRRAQRPRRRRLGTARCGSPNKRPP